MEEEPTCCVCDLILNSEEIDLNMDRGTDFVSWMCFKCDFVSWMCFKCDTDFVSWMCFKCDEEDF